MTNQGRVDRLKDIFIHQLFNNSLNHFFQASFDPQNASFFSCLTRDWQLFDSRKYVWMMARQVWLYMRVANLFTKEQIAEKSSSKIDRDEMIKQATASLEFLLNNAVQKDRVLFCLTRQGKPLLHQRKIFSAAFLVIATAQTALCLKSSEYREKSIGLFRMMMSWVKNPSLLCKQSLEGMPASSSLNVPMIVLNTVLELRATRLSPQENTIFQEEAEWAASQLLFHKHPFKKYLLQAKGQKGEYLVSTFEGRCFNAGHSIEGGWFLLYYGSLSKRQDLIKEGLQIIKTSFEEGWDKERGGITYFKDSEGFAPVQLQADQKLWWPISQALVALSMAYRVSKDQYFLDKLQLVWQWTEKHMLDSKHGQWFGYLDKECKVTSLDFKAGPYKCCFHVGRGLLYSCQSLERDTFEFLGVR